MNSNTIKQQLIELEPLLIQPATRLSAELLNRYLADDFYEIAASGEGVQYSVSAWSQVDMSV